MSVNWWVDLLSIIVSLFNDRLGFAAYRSSACVPVCLTQKQSITRLSIIELIDSSSPSHWLQDAAIGRQCVWVYWFRSVLHVKADVFLKVSMFKVQAV